MTYHRTKSEHQQRVEEFMRFAEQALPALPTLPDENVRRLRASLILEEALETIVALGFSPRLNVLPGAPPFPVIELKAVAFVPDQEPDLEQIADGCADLSVVNVGTLSACGISDGSLLELVDGNNLDKFRLPGGWRRSDGKWMKPPGHKPPRIDSLLVGQTDFVRSNF